MCLSGMTAAADHTVPVPADSDVVIAMEDFEDFVRVHVPSLVRTAFLLTGGDGPAAEDAVQETLTRLYPRWARVQQSDHPLAYVRRSLINTYLNSVRSMSAREFVVRDAEDRTQVGDMTQAVGDRDQIRQLPERQRVALVLRYFDDLTDREVARAMGCRPGTARSLISRGLASVRATLSPEQLGDRDA
jgi:RNA polymerase sigma-70 factor (sigma-E family)